MRWLKRERWKAGILVAGLLLFLVLMVWVPASAVGASERAAGPAAPGTAPGQTPPTEDATMTVLQKELLTLQMTQLTEQQNWFWNNGAAFFSALVVVGGGLFGFWQWRVNRDDTRTKESNERKEAQDKDLKDKAEERFKTAVTALGDEKEGVQLGGAILLRSFLHKDDEKIYGRYSPQIFDLAVAYLRLARTAQPPEEPNAPLPLPPLRQALITVFKESFLRARKELETTKARFEAQWLDAAYVQLDHAYLVTADLAQAWLARASLRQANLKYAQLEAANLSNAHLEGTILSGAQLQGAQLEEAQLQGAILSGAHLERAILNAAHLQGVNLTDAHLEGASLWQAQLEGVDLTDAHLQGVDLTEANPEAAASLQGAKMNGVTGLRPVQQELCIQKGAIFDAVQQAPPSATSSSS